MDSKVVEILAGGGIETAFKELGIEATCTYKNPEATLYEVWEITKDDMMMMEFVANWPDKYGWWTYSDGSVMGNVNKDMTINGQKILAWLDEGRVDALRYDWEHESKEEKEAYNFNFDEYVDDWYTDYPNLLEYFALHLGASKASNVFALSQDLAKANNMSVAQLFTTYLG